MIVFIYWSVNRCESQIRWSSGQKTMYHNFAIWLFHKTFRRVLTKKMIKSVKLLFPYSCWKIIVPRHKPAKWLPSELTPWTLHNSRVFHKIAKNKITELSEFDKYQSSKWIVRRKFFSYILIPKFCVLVQRCCTVQKTGGGRGKGSVVMWWA